MRFSPPNPTKAWIVASTLVLLSPSARAADGETGSTDRPPGTDTVTRDRLVDEAPSDEVLEVAAEPSDDSNRGTARRRRWRDGPRRVPTPRGASLARATSLGLGTVDAARELLREAPRASWKRAAGARIANELRWPVEIGALGRGFGFVRHDRPEVRHNGVDIATPRGMVIRAAADGIVAYSDNGLRGYGNCVIIVHPNGWVTLYAHADRTTVQAGYRVRRGERIGFVGSTGRSDGPHLHFELRVDGSPIDPLESFVGEPWIEGRVRLAVLRRDHGGHRRDHLGELTPDYASDVPPQRAAAPVATQTLASSLPTSVERLLARGPTNAERAELRAHAVDQLEPPIRLEVSSTFTDSVLRYHAPTSTNVRAAAAGRVAYVGPGVRDGMTTVVLVHANGWVTLYGGVLDATVTAGALVSAGDRLAIVRDARVGLAFELRSRGRSLDPRTHLPAGPELVATRE